MKPYETIPFTNSLDQVIQPGDRIVVVTGGRGSTINTYDGVYLGCRKFKNWRGSEQVETVVEVKAEGYGYFDKETGAKVTWQHHNYERRRYDYTRRATIWSGRIFKLA